MKHSFARHADAPSWDVTASLRTSSFILVCLSCRVCRRFCLSLIYMRFLLSLAWARLNNFNHLRWLEPLARRLFRACWRSLASPYDLFFVRAYRTSHQGVVNLIVDPKDRRKVSHPNFIYATEIEILRANQNIICPTEIRSNSLRKQAIIRRTTQFYLLIEITAVAIIAVETCKFRLLGCWGKS